METIGPAIDNFLEKYGLKKQLQARKYLSAWDKIVGPKISRHARPLTINKKKLIVEVNDSNWLYHLTMLKGRIIKDFNQEFHEEIISEIKFINADFISREIYNNK
ncbi:MAG TPA: DUF721 domain-containing protein [Firmicutes bacterium]|jgi:predicted nucleic acid-binding Zn ribbon protein|nr:DUF721 domain-containing protein [Bacillota bacterium]